MFKLFKLFKKFKKPTYHRYISAIDLFLNRWRETHPLSESQKQEISTDERIAKKRDGRSDT